MSKDTFKDNPELKEVFTTADGTDFYSRNAAENHARSLKDRSVTRKTNPSNKEVTALDMDDPKNVSLGLVQTGVNENGDPELKQVVAKIGDTGSVDVVVANVNDASSTDKTAVKTENASKAQPAAKKDSKATKPKAQKAEVSAVKDVQPEDAGNKNLEPQK